MAFRHERYNKTNTGQSMSTFSSDASSKDLFRYEAVTRAIHVLVAPRFLEDQSDPDNSQFVWAYDIEIRNEGVTTVQLKERTWSITDGNGEIEEVHGPGVVGEQPILQPGDAFQYSSGCPLRTPSGFMVGRYTMQAENGETFEIDIPAFALDLPNAVKTMN